MTAYIQTWLDVEARIGSRAKAGQIGGNFNTLVMLRVKNTETAELLTDQLPDVNLVSMMVVSSASDTSDFADFASRNEDRISTEAHPPVDPGGPGPDPERTGICLDRGRADLQDQDAIAGQLR